MGTTPRRTRRALAALTILVTVAAAGGCSTRFTTGAAASGKIDPAILDSIEAGHPTTYWVRFDAEADLSGVGAGTDWAARGKAVVHQLQATAADSQAVTIEYLQLHRVDFEPFWITDAIRVTSDDMSVVADLAAEQNVVAITSPETLPLPESGPIAADDPGTTSPPPGAEWGLAAIGAPTVWQQTGKRGDGIVVANIDTGVQFDHPDLVHQYRGSDPNGTFDHAYNWFDPTGTCTDAPCDDVGHGTHTMGTMVGDEGRRGGNETGVAPHAQWIAAKGCASTTCSDADVLAAAQWLLAPTDPTGANPRPDLRPDVIDNPWAAAAGDAWFRDVVKAWTASGIFAPFAAGNGGPDCGTAVSPAGDHDAFAAGAYGPDGAIAGFSGRGQGALDDATGPDVAAPGVDVRSSVPGGYATLSGTSMASAHVAGAVALMWSAAPSIAGNVGLTRWVLDTTAVDVDDTSCGGSAGHNNVWGEGRLDALAATTKALDPTTGVPQLVVTSPHGAYPLNARVLADYHCEDEVDPQPTCTGDVADGAPIDTSTPGRHELHFTLANRYGYTGTATVTYTVAACNGLAPTIMGGPGDDHLEGTSGDDVIYDVAGDNTVDAGVGKDTICTGPGDDVVDGGDGSDWVDAGAGANIVDGGRGDNTVSSLQGNDLIMTGDGDDTIAAGDGNNVVEAGAGRDTVVAGGGNDTINAGDGDDIVDAGAGDNTVMLGSGDDRATAGAGVDLIDGGAGTDSCDAGEGANRVARCES